MSNSVLSNPAASADDSCSVQSDVGTVFDRPALWRYAAAAVLDVDVTDLPAAMSPGPMFPAALQTAVASMPRNVGTIVDLGAGAGGASEWVRASTGAEVIAVEPAPRARLVARLLFPELRVVDGSAERAPLADESADVVTMWGVASLVADLGPVLAETARLLRPGGLVVIADLVSGSEDTWSNADNSFRSIEALELQLLHAGFSLVNVGCGHVTVDQAWGDVARRIDEWIEGHCAERSGFDRWRNDKRRIAALTSEGAVLGAVLVAQRSLPAGSGDWHVAHASSTSVRSAGRVPAAQSRSDGEHSDPAPGAGDRGPAGSGVDHHAVHTRHTRHTPHMQTGR